MSDFADEDLSSEDSNWDSSDDEGEKKEEKKAPVGKKKGLKGLQAKIAAREEREKQEKALREMAPEDRQAQQKKVEEDELISATEFVDITDPESIDIGKFVPKSKFEFEKYAEAVTARMKGLHESPFYTDFVCNLTREFIKPLKVDDTRKVETVLKVQINDLIKSSKGKKKNSKKIGLNSGGGKGGVDTNRYDDAYEDMDDLL